MKQKTSDLPFLIIVAGVTMLALAWGGLCIWAVVLGAKALLKYLGA